MDSWQGPDTLSALQTRLVHRPELHAHIVLTGPPQPAGGRPRRLIEQMRANGAIGARLQVVELPDVQAEGAVVDTSWALIESAQVVLHPSKKGYGFRYTQVHFISERTAIRHFLEP